MASTAGEPHVSRETLTPELDVSRETLARLKSLEALVSKWTAAISLVGAADIPHLWQRHILDSAQLFARAPACAASWIDLGAGAGFPGLVVAAIAATERPALAMTLVESDQRKCAFLRNAARALAIRVAVVQARIEDVPARDVDVVSARALAPLDRIFAMSLKFWGPGTTGLFPKGRQVTRELAMCEPGWTFRAARVTSITSPDATILKVTELRRVPPPR